jgi:hypothetical protein
MDCINCGRALESNFCPDCGQRARVKRISFKEGWFDFWSRVYGFDGMFPRTLRDLTIHPGHVARKFIAGNRISYYGPVGYFFLMITVCLLIFSIMNLDFVEYAKGMQSRFPVQGSSKLSRDLMQFVSDNLKIFAFMTIPFQALSAKFVFFRKSNYNFIEHSVLPFYAMGHIYWLVILLGIILKVTGVSLAGFSIVITMLYFGYAYSGFIDGKSKTASFLRGLGTYLLGQLLFTLAGISLALLAAYLLSVFAPDIYESIKPSNNQ